MLDFGYYNADCMDYLKDFPDNYFDLAIADPPYGDANTDTIGGGGGSVNDLTATSRINRGGWHGKQKYHLGETLHVRTPEEVQKLREPEEHGRRNTQKNYCVGRSAGTIIL